SVVFKRALFFKCHSHNCHDLVAINNRPMMLHRQETVGLTVQSHAQVRAMFQNSSLKVFHMGGAIVLVNISTIRIGADNCNLGTGISEYLWCHTSTCSVSSVNDHF